jgi:hypothetical protein
MATNVRTDPDTRVRSAVLELADALLAVAREGAVSAPESSPVELLDVPTFARRCGIGRSTAYLGVGDGSIRSVKVRGRRLIPASEVARIAAQANP